MRCTSQLASAVLVAGASVGAYADSKLLDVVLAFAVARHWPRVYSNALEPGWVATKMGGPEPPTTSTSHR